MQTPGAGVYNLRRLICIVGAPRVGSDRVALPTRGDETDANELDGIADFAARSCRLAN